VGTEGSVYTRAVDPELGGTAVVPRQTVCADTCKDNAKPQPKKALDAAHNS
jgi:hypothetical protein